MCSDRAAQMRAGPNCRRVSHWRTEFDAALTLAVSDGGSASRFRRILKDEVRERKPHNRIVCVTAATMIANGHARGELPPTPGVLDLPVGTCDP
jgi:hypothetical protein